MSLAKSYTAGDATWLQSFVGLFFKPARLQIAALCVRPGETENEILLVSTRDTGRLILPKGWPEPHQQAYETASTEAYEEAGVLGRAETRPLGTFRSYKGLGNGSKIRTKVMVFKLQFEKQLKKFPEIGQRECHWVPFSKGIELADEPALKRFLRRHRMEIA
ncbi:NUDIX hydrolase [Roseibium sp. HPY-6]|uniref:NUDIX hydrolase n=1 Tax=Roseibium sp. HPY-6 TaxID=3229852 RepID=UPI00338E4743